MNFEWTERWNELTVPCQISSFDFDFDVMTLFLKKKTLFLCSCAGVLARMAEATSSTAGSGVGITPAWLAPQGSANTAAWSKLTEEEASKARALGHRHPQGQVALAVLLNTRS